jgi:flagellar hook-associated protein 1
MSLMNVGVSALNTNQSALTTIGHNIANANTTGYSRQTVATKAITGQNTGFGFIGKGVQVHTVVRHYNDLLGRQSNAANAASAADAIRYQSLMQMQDVYSGGDSSLGAAINGMMNAFADVEAAPADGTARNVVLTRMSELTARFRSAAATLNELDYSTQQQLTNNVTLVNNLAGQVATLNTQIARSIASGHQPNDLLDARDQLIREINQYIQTSQVDADDGTISLFVGGSQALVLGSTTGLLSVAETKEYPGSQKMALYFSQPGGLTLELTGAMVGGGEMAGLLKFNNEDLVAGRNMLGRLALTIATALNAQNQLGLTLSGEYGSALFQLNTVATGASDITHFTRGNANTAASATATVTDSHALVASDYKIIFGDSDASGKQASLVRLSDGKKIDMGRVAAGDSLNFTYDGLTFAVDATSVTNAQRGQSVLFQPFAHAANEIQPLVHSANDLAVSSALTAAMASSNLGSLQLTALSTQDLARIPNAQQPLQLVFEANNGYRFQYQANGATYTYPAAGEAALVYTSGSAITLPAFDGANPPQLDPNDATAGTYPAWPNGWSITMTGTPQAGDTVSVGNAKDLGEGFKLNAGNASAFLSLRDAKVFDGGTSLSDGFSAAMAVIGTRTQSAQYAAQLSETVANNLTADRTAVSGVNLDEEAARLLQYQQAYQASAKVISTAQSLFDSLLSAVGGR